MKRKIGILLVIAALMLGTCSLVSCSKNEIPDGYQLIARDGDTFRLYVPKQGWMPNTSSGITSACFGVASEETGYASATVSVYMPDDAEGYESAQAYWDAAAEKLSAELDGYKYIESESGKTVLGGEVAVKSVYTAKSNTGISDPEKTQAVTYKYMQITAKHGEEIYVLLFVSPEADYANRIVAMNGDPEEDDLGIIGNFKFADAYVSEDDSKYDKNDDGVDGMRLVSQKGRPYKLYAPDSWSIDKSAEITSVYTADRSNLTVQYIMPGTDDLDVDNYWDSCVAGYESVMTEFAVGEKTTTKVAGIEGSVVGTFTGKSSGVEYKFKQAIILKGEVYYVITYTATAENYELHIADADKMISNFKIK